MNFALGLSVLQNLVVVLFVLICLAIILIVLLQKGRGGGIGAAFGGGGAGSLLGTKTGDFLTWVTICLVAAFLVLAVLMGKFMRPKLPGGTPLPAAPVTSQPADAPAAPAADTPAPAETEAADTATDTVEDVESWDIGEETGTESTEPAEPTD